MDMKKVETHKWLERLQDDKTEEELKRELEHLQARMLEMAKFEQFKLVYEREKLNVQSGLEKICSESRWMQLEHKMKEMEIRMRMEREEGLRTQKEKWRAILRRHEEEWQEKYLELLRERQSEHEKKKEMEWRGGKTRRKSENKKKYVREEQLNEFEEMKQTVEIEEIQEKTGSEKRKTAVKEREKEEKIKKMDRKAQKEMEIIKKREKTERKKKERDSEQREKNQCKDKLLLGSEKQKEVEKQTESRDRQLEIQRIKEARQKHTEGEKQQKGQRMNKVFCQTLALFKKKVNQKTAGKKVSNASFINGVQQESSVQETKPEEETLSWSASTVPQLICVKPLHPSPGPAEEQPDPSPPSVTDPVLLSPENKVGNDSSTVSEQPLTLPQASSGPEGQDKEAQTKAGKRVGPKYKSKRRRLIGWVNKKVKEGHQRDMQKSIKREEEHGHELLQIRSTLWTSGEDVTVAQVEQEKRRLLLQLEKDRRVMEARWRKWEQQRAEKKAEKKAKKEEKSEAVLKRMRRAVGYLVNKIGTENQRPTTAVESGRSKDPAALEGSRRSQTPLVLELGGRSQSPPVPERLREVKVCWT